MSLKIPKELKSEFKKGFNQYIKAMGRPIQVVLDPTQVSCPNCIWDNVQGKSSNVYNESFKKPVNIFPATDMQTKVYPQPFNVTSVSGVQYDPSLIDPKILRVSVCPVCLGEGVLISENTSCIVAVITTGYGQTGTEASTFIDLSAGRDGRQITRLKTKAENYAICRDAQYFIVDGIKMEIEIPAKLKGLGNLSITEVYLGTVKEDSSSNTKYDGDQRVNINQTGQSSDQADDSTPTIPPSVPGDDVW